MTPQQEARLLRARAETLQAQALDLPKGEEDTECCPGKLSRFAKALLGEHHETLVVAAELEAQIACINCGHVRKFHIEAGSLPCVCAEFVISRDDSRRCGCPSFASERVTT